MYSQLNQPEVMNHFLLVVTVMAAWLAALMYMGGKQVFWDYDSHPEDSN